jgi:hypothetical protein
MTEGEEHVRCGIRLADGVLLDGICDGRGEVVQMQQGGSAEVQHREGLVPAKVKIRASADVDRTEQPRRRYVTARLDRKARSREEEDERGERISGNHARENLEG